MRAVWVFLITVGCLLAGGALADNFVEASARCMQIEGIPADYRARFDRFDYPDEPRVHRFVRCVWERLGLWNESSGFEVERIAERYKEQANIEILIPVLNICNRNPEGYNPVRWCYTAFKCILNSRVGIWFKNEVNAQRAAAENHV